MRMDSPRTPVGTVALVPAKKVPFANAFDRMMDVTAKGRDQVGAASQKGTNGMRRILIAVLFLAAGAARLHAGEAEGRLQQGDYVAVLGDSMPVVYGQAPIAPQLYSNIIEAYLLMCKPAADLGLTQFGFPGTTSYNYATYLMANDLLRFQPTAAAVWFGMAEGGWSPMNPDKAKHYRDGLTAIVRGMKKANVRLIVLGSPSCIDGDTCNGGPDRADMYNKTLAAFRDTARDVAREEGVPFANIFDLMMDVAAKGKAKYGKPYTLVGDGNIWSIPRKGHLVMAYAFLKALGCDGDIGTISVDMTADRTRPKPQRAIRCCRWPTAGSRSKAPGIRSASEGVRHERPRYAGSLSFSRSTTT